MKIRSLFILCFALIFGSAISAAAQTKTVTNFDLEKYKQQRLAADKDYRDNYERLGFPSPEELDKQLEKSRVEREQLSEKLRAERLERERIEASRTPVYYQQQVAPTSGYQTDGSLIYSGGYYFPRYRPIGPWGNNPLPVPPNHSRPPAPAPPKPRWLKM